MPSIGDDLQGETRKPRDRTVIFDEAAVPAGSVPRRVFLDLAVDGPSHAVWMIWVGDRLARFQGIGDRGAARIAPRPDQGPGAVTVMAPLSHGPQPTRATAMWCPPAIPQIGGERNPVEIRVAGTPDRAAPGSAPKKRSGRRKASRPCRRSRSRRPRPARHGCGPSGRGSCPGRRDRTGRRGRCRSAIARPMR